jgi:fructan beta-fructosidase
MHAELYSTTAEFTELRLFVDRSSLEVFANDGLSCLTSCCFPQSPYSTLQLQLRAGALDAVSAQIYHLE